MIRRGKTRQIYAQFECVFMCERDSKESGWQLKAKVSKVYACTISSVNMWVHSVMSTESKIQNTNTLPAHIYVEQIMVSKNSLCHFTISCTSHSNQLFILQFALKHSTNRKGWSREKTQTHIHIHTQQQAKNGTTLPQNKCDIIFHCFICWLWFTLHINLSEVTFIHFVRTLSKFLWYFTFLNSYFHFAFH